MESTASEPSWMVASTCIRQVESAPPETMARTPSPRGRRSWRAHQAATRVSRGDRTAPSILTRPVALHLQTDPVRQAPLVLCPGDPGRAELVARELLEGAELVTEARGLLGYTGRWRGVPVTVQTTGMGGGSTAIVVTELVELGARALVRAGSAGGLQQGVKLGTLVVADAAWADDGAGLALGGPVAPPPDPALTDAVEAAAARRDGAVIRGPVVSTDLFYDPEPGRVERWSGSGLLAVEMEAAVLFALAARLGVRAGCLLTVSNVLVGEPGWTDRDTFAQAGLAVSEPALDGLVGTPR
jgi:DeoD family purine-nucleoside phosphorylase